MRSFLLLLLTALLLANSAWADLTNQLDSVQSAVTLSNAPTCSAFQPGSPETEARQKLDQFCGSLAMNVLCEGVPTDLEDALPRATGAMPERLKQQALLKVARDHHLNSVTMEDIRTNIDPEMHVAYFRALEELVYKRVPANLFTERLKQKVLDRISLQSALNDQKSKLSKVVRSRGFSTVSQYLDAQRGLLGYRGDAWSKGIRMISERRMCDVDGLAENAGSYDNQLFLCPGRALDMLSSADPMEQLWRSDTFSMAHEIGHSIDSSSQSIYGAFQKCVNDKLVLPALAQNKKQFSELAADYWGTEALAEVIESERNANKTAPAQAMLRTVRGNLVQFCGVSGGGDHPETILRLQLISRNPRIRQALGCQPLGPTDFGCDLSGRTH